MNPSRRELLQSIGQLILMTQELVRATEENTRMFHRLREDIARLNRQPRSRRTSIAARATRVQQAGNVIAIRARRSP